MIDDWFYVWIYVAPRFNGTDLFDKILQLVTPFLPQEQ